jgi:hypothetical protein
MRGHVVGTDSVLVRCLARLQEGTGMQVLVGWERGARPRAAGRRSGLHDRAA